jgi:hypothetical protein
MEVPFFTYSVEKRRKLMDNETLWGYIDQLENMAQGILDLTAELHQITGPRLPLTHTPGVGAVVPPKKG